MTLELHVQGVTVMAPSTNALECKCKFTNKCEVKNVSFYRNPALCEDEGKNA